MMDVWFHCHLNISAGNACSENMLKDLLKKSHEETQNSKEVTLNTLVPLPSKCKQATNGETDHVVFYDGHTSFAVDQDGHRASIFFETQTNPPHIWLKKVSTQFPLLSFFLSYYEPDEEIVGELVAKNGIITDDRSDPAWETVHMLEEDEFEGLENPPADVVEAWMNEITEKFGL